MPGKINSLTNEQQAELLKNTYNVEKLEMTEQVQHNCPLGEQVGVTTYKIQVVPGNQLAELIQLHWDIQEMVGKTYTLESGADHVLQILKKHYTDAKFIQVVSSCPSNRHMAVDVTVSYKG